MSRLDRAAVWRRLGAPAEQIGSVNDPRTVQEHGVTWNEKWLHLDGRGCIERVVLWDRYDLVGIFRIDQDGVWHPDPLSEVGKAEEGRLKREGTPAPRTLRPGPPPRWLLDP